MTLSRKSRPFLLAFSVAAALVAGAAKAQDLPRTVPLCSLDQEAPLSPRVLNRIRARADFEDLLRYASENCAEVALLLADTATATVPGDDDGETGGGREGPEGRNSPAEEPPAEEPPAEEPPAEEPPAEEPPAEEPPAEEPPVEEGGPRTPQWTNPLR